MAQFESINPHSTLQYNFWWMTLHPFAGKLPARLAKRHGQAILEIAISADTAIRNHCPGCAYIVQTHSFRSHHEPDKNLTTGD
jgi:hypothetical protein